MKDTDTFDFIIVGAGSAGCVIAARLSEDPDRRVLLVEAGGRDRGLGVRLPAGWTNLIGTAAEWGQVSDGGARIDQQLSYVHGRMLGGTSSLNAQLYLRGHRSDYDGWAESGCAGWSYGNVLPYFLRSEDNATLGAPYHAAGGALRVEELRDPNQLSHAFVGACLELGIPSNSDFNGATLDGVRLAQVTQKRGRRWSSADAFLKPARRRPNLTILGEALVYRVLLERGRAVGITYGSGGTTRVARATREVIVAAGAINSPSLLLRSGIGPAGELRALDLPIHVDLPGVGMNLQDHATVPLLWECRAPVSLFAAESAGNLARYFLLRRGMLTSNIVEATAFLRTQPNEPAPNLEMMFLPALFLNQGLTSPDRHGFTLAPVVLKPKSRGRVRLASADPRALPIVELNLFSDLESEDLTVMLHGIELARRIAAGSPFSRFGIRAVEPGPEVSSESALRAFLRKRGQTAYHAAGTCRMGMGPDAVTDPQLRVRGIDGLRVADTSIMPTIIRGHTHAPAVMIGEYAAQLIRSDVPIAPRRSRGMSEVVSGRLFTSLLWPYFT